MKIAFAALLLLTAFGANAQEQTIGLRGGMGEMNIRSDIFRNYSHARHCLSFGLTYERFVARHITFGADLLFQQRGFSNDVTFIDENNRETGRASSPFAYDYVAVPLKVGLNYGNKFFGFASLGLVPAVLVNAAASEPDIYDNGTLVYAGKTYNLTKQVDRFDLGGVAEAGGGYSFNRACQIYASFSYQHGITSITNRNYFDGSQMRHYGYFLSLGFRYALTRQDKTVQPPPVEP